MNTTPNSLPPVPPCSDPAPAAAARVPAAPSASVRSRNLRVLAGTLLVAVLSGGVLLVQRGGDVAGASTLGGGLGSGMGGAEPLQLVASALPDEGSGSAASSTSEPAGGEASRAERRAERRAEMDASIARHLGVTVDELHEARLAALGERLDEAVDAGRLTRDQADELLDAAREGRLREAIRELRGELRAERRGGR